MKIGGLMKLTLLDYPGVIACTVFIEGCNFRCPFCHNSGMVFSESPDEIAEDEFFEFLRKRQGVLEGVCVTGGEPLISPEIFGFLEKIKGLGYKVKLDTNGSFPERLKKIVEMNLCDYVAMDIKNSPEKYSITSGNDAVSFETVKQSIEFLKASGIQHEFRTTVVKDFHTKADVAQIAELLGENEKYFIQPFRDGESVICQGLGEFDTGEVKELLESAREFVPDAMARGIDL
ncbi:MAG: anaerobic ribonucleoside-triphosphate reductase activating protein [Clostridia bacterium]|nr:anaerobic ribonucleoside-triphosphate reductase activating protein [Clostridia bacterium]